MSKQPKYKTGDILKYTNPIISRWDKTSDQRVAWKYKLYPNGTTEYAAPEEELSIIEESK
jgi:hypothetical protein